MDVLTNFIAVIFSQGTPILNHHMYTLNIKQFYSLIIPPKKPEGKERIKEIHV